MSRKEDFIKIDLKKRVFKAGFCVKLFVDHGHQIAYVPTLDMTGYGDNPQEALDMLIKVALPEYLHTLLDLSEHQLKEELSNYGFKQASLFKKQFKNKMYIDKEGILKNFELSENAEIKEQYVNVA